jgi:hypothetical protein
MSLGGIQDIENQLTYYANAPKMRFWLSATYVVVSQILEKKDNELYENNRRYK